MNKTIILVFIAEFWLTFGQINFKKSANLLNNEKDSEKPWIFKLISIIGRYPTIWLGAASMLIGLLFWFAALTSGELSYVYLLGSTQYIFTLFAAHFLLHEKINATKLIGTILITLGIIITAVS